MPVSFTSRNIRLDDGSYTKPDVGYSMDVHPWFLAAKLKREFLLQSLRDLGSDLVLEQFDGLGPNIAFEMTAGSYRTSGRSTFIGIKTSYASDTQAPAVSPGLRQA